MSDQGLQARRLPTNRGLLPGISLTPKSVNSTPLKQGEQSSTTEVDKRSTQVIRNEESQNRSPDWTPDTHEQWTADVTRLVGTGERKNTGRLVENEVTRKHSSRSDGMRESIFPKPHFAPAREACNATETYMHNAAHSIQDNNKKGKS